MAPDGDLVEAPADTTPESTWMAAMKCGGGNALCGTKYLVPKPGDGQGENEHV